MDIQKELNIINLFKQLHQLEYFKKLLAMNPNEYIKNFMEKAKIARLLYHLNDLRDLVMEDAKSKGWHAEKPNFGAFISNLHGEVSELWESWRKDSLNQPCDKADKMVENGLEPLTCIEEELADIIIRALDTAATFNVDIEKSILNKILFNRTRPHRNGNKLA